MTRRRPTINHWVTAPVESVAPALYRLPKRGATLEHHLWWIQDRLASFGKPRVVQPELAIETEEEAPPAAPALRGRFETPEPDARVRRQDDTFVLSAVDDTEQDERRFPPGFVFVEEPFIPSPPPVLAPVAISIPVPSREETIDALLRASPELLAAARLLLNAETAGAGLFADHARGAVERALKKVELPPMLSSAAAAPAIVDVAASQTEDDGFARARSALDSGEPPINSLKARVAVTYDYTPGQEPYLVSLTSRTLPLFGDHDAARIQVDAEALVTDGADNFLFDPDDTRGSELTVSAEPADDIDEIIGRIRLFTASLEEDETPAAAVAAVVEEPALDLTQVAEAPLLPGDPLAEGERDEDDIRRDNFGAFAADFDLGQPTEDLNIAEMVALGVPLPAIEEDETAPKRKRGFTILRNASAYLKRCQRRARDMVTAFNDPLAKVVDRVNGAVVMAHARSLTGPVDSEAAPVADTPRRKRARISLPSPLRRRLRMAGAAVKNFEKGTKAIRLAASLVMLSAASSSAPIIAPQLDPEQPIISDAGEARLLALPDAAIKDNFLQNRYQFGLPIWQADLPANCTLPRLVSDFGPRANPFGSGTQLHYGLDVGRPLCDGEVMSEATASGVPIRAMQDGIIISYGTGGAAYGAVHGGRSYGHNVVVISRPDGDATCAWREQDQGAMAIRYAHMSRPMTAEGESPVCTWVNQGDIIGYMGGTGRSQAVHLDARAGYVTLAQQGTAWVPTNIDYINLAAPGMLDLDAYEVNQGLSLNTLAQTYTVAYNGPVRHRARPVESEASDAVLIEEENDEDHDIDGVEPDTVFVASGDTLAGPLSVASIVDGVQLPTDSATVEEPANEPIPPDRPAPDVVPTGEVQQLALLIPAPPAVP